jgi:hypothetical protein
MDTEDTKETFRNRFFYPMYKQGYMEQADRRPHLQNIMAARGEQASRKKDEFFDEAYAEILMDLFIRWSQTELHETEFRESLYQNTLALGSIKMKLAEYEVYGRNAPFLGPENEDDDEK